MNDHYIIDGNNLIGKITSLKLSNSKGNDSSRIGLVNILNGFFISRKIRITLHFDGYPNAIIPLIKGKIVYSENRTSDDLIREEIEQSKNPKLITLVSSDRSLIDYAHVNSCRVVKSEDFVSEIEKNRLQDEETVKLKELEKQNKLFYKLFGG
jgi:uncharacterized protein